MSKQCDCGSYAINHHCHGRDGSDPDLCDVCYWRKRAGALEGDRLPCSVLLEPGVRFGKGVPVSTLLLGIRNRQEYEKQQESLTPSQRKQQAKRIAEFKQMLNGL
jgi:hypothetical protein